MVRVNLWTGHAMPVVANREGDTSQVSAREVSQARSRFPGARLLSAWRIGISVASLSLSGQIPQPGNS